MHYTIVLNSFFELGDCKASGAVKIVARELAGAPAIPSGHPFFDVSVQGDGHSRMKLLTFHSGTSTGGTALIWNHSAEIRVADENYP